MHHGDPLTLSWAGGHNGRKVIDKFLNMVNYVLSERGFGYLLVLKENHPDKIMRKLQEKHWDCQIIARRKIRCEELFVLKFVRTKL